jgi:hypothetical protein
MANSRCAKLISCAYYLSKLSSFIPLSAHTASICSAWILPGDIEIDWYIISYLT